MTLGSQSGNMVAETESIGQGRYIIDSSLDIIMNFDIYSRRTRSSSCDSNIKCAVEVT